MIKKEDLVNLLASHRTIGKAPRAELEWIADHGTILHYEPGQIVVRETETVDALIIMFTGRVAIHVHRGTGRKRMMDWQGGDVTGLLPYSRLTHPPGDTVVEEPIDAIQIHRNDLPEMIRNCYEVTATLVHVMTDRARRFTSTDLRDEKMISLGKLAAGLAHELNNPASAAKRDAEELTTALTVADDAARALGAAGLSPDQRAELDAVRSFCLRSTNHRPLTGLPLSDREDALAMWLQNNNISDTHAEELARTPLSFDLLDRLARSFQGAPLDAALRWIVSGYAARSLVADIGRATARIHALVAATKGFTHMDRSTDHEPIDISRGLRDTAALLDGKARAKSITLTLDLSPDLPCINGYSAEINQVWMNLIDNAIDAAPAAGHVTVSAAREQAALVVRVADDGPGIPPEIRDSIFDPFFTTKPVGEGSGIGLDIVQRVVRWHNGEINVDSRPGRTVFRVSIPTVNGAT